MENLHLVFVYGTLRPGHGNNRLLATSQHIGTFETKTPHFLMLGMGIPYVYPMEDGYHIRGDLYEVDDDVLADLDRLESNGYHYERRPVLLKDNVLAWMYHGMGNALSPDMDIDRIEFDPYFVQVVDGAQDWSAHEEHWASRRTKRDDLDDIPFLEIESQRALPTPTDDRSFRKFLSSLRLLGT